MNQRVLGFVLVSVAVVAAILAFTFAQGYNTRAPLTWNLANAELFSTYVTCSRPTGSLLEDIPRNCPQTPAEWPAGSPFTGQVARTIQVKTFSLRLGVGLALLFAVGMAGVGLIAFGRGQQP